MADSTVGQLFNFIGNTDYSDYSRGGMVLGAGAIKGENKHISGTTTDSSTPVARTVYILDLENNRIDKIKTDTSGSFDFKYLRSGKYFVLGINEDESQDSIVHAFIQPVSL